MTDLEPVTGKVAAVLSSREIAINRGHEHGVLNGTKFAVLDPNIGEIRDPDTRELLGVLRREKIRVEVSSVYPRFAVARTYERPRESHAGMALEGVAAMFQSGVGARVRTLRDPGSGFESISEEESIVKVGDPVEQIIESSSDSEVETPGEDAPVEERT